MTMTEFAQKQDRIKALLVCSITRLVHFGLLPDEVRRKAEATARIDATSIAATRPGRRFYKSCERLSLAKSAFPFARLNE